LSIDSNEENFHILEKFLRSEQDRRRMKPAKFFAIAALVLAIGLVLYKLLQKDGYSAWSAYDFTSPPLPILKPGYTGAYTGAMLPEQKAESRFDYATIPWTWSRV
jgi:hypothetical protein